MRRYLPTQYTDTWTCHLYKNPNSHRHNTTPLFQTLLQALSPSTPPQHRHTSCTPPVPTGLLQLLPKSQFLSVLVIESEGGKKKFVCKVCNEMFVKRSLLDGHMPLHTGQKPYGCSICEDRFWSKAHRKTHMKTHLGRGNRLYLYGVICIF